MTTRILVFAALVLLCITFNTTLDTFQPSIDVAVAVDQFQDSEVAAQTARGLFRFEAALSLLSWSATLLAGAFLFRKNIVNTVRALFDDLKF